MKLMELVDHLCEHYKAYDGEYTHCLTQDDLYHQKENKETRAKIQAIADHLDMVENYACKGYFMSDFKNVDDMRAEYYHVRKIADSLEWIPVSERLPEEGEDCLLSHGYKHSSKKVVIKARYIKRFTEESSPCAEDCYEYNEGKDQYYWNEGWVEACEHGEEYGFIYISPSAVPVEWMLLPNPKEK